MSRLFTIVGTAAVLAFAASAPAAVMAQASPDATAQSLMGSWGHPVNGVWTFSSNGTGTLVRNSVNGIPGRYTITLNWSVEPGNTLVYTPIRNTLEGSGEYDRDEPIASPRTSRAVFQLRGNALTLGGIEYLRQ